MNPGPGCQVKTPVDGSNVAPTGIVRRSPATTSNARAETAHAALADSTALNCIRSISRTRSARRSVVPSVGDRALSKRTFSSVPDCIDVEDDAWPRLSTVKNRLPMPSAFPRLSYTTQVIVCVPLASVVVSSDENPMAPFVFVSPGKSVAVSG